VLPAGLVDAFCLCICGPIAAVARLAHSATGEMSRPPGKAGVARVVRFQHSSTPGSLVVRSLLSTGTSTSVSVDGWVPPRREGKSHRGPPPAEAEGTIGELVG